MNTTRQSYTDKSEAEKVKLKTGIEIGAKIYIYIYIYLRCLTLEVLKNHFLGQKVFLKFFK